jgi:hypothetical protein
VLTRRAHWLLISGHLARQESEPDLLSRCLIGCVRTVEGKTGASQDFRARGGVAGAEATESSARLALQPAADHRA